MVDPSMNPSVALNLAVLGMITQSLGALGCSVGLYITEHDVPASILLAWFIFSAVISLGMVVSTARS